MISYLNCTYRPAASDELGRAASLCTPAPARPGESRQHCFVAVRSKPVERIMAVAYWKIVPETDCSLTAEIQWIALPAMGAEISNFLRALIAHIPAIEPAVTTLAAAEWLPDGHPAAAALLEVGFSPTATRTVYQAGTTSWLSTLGEKTDMPAPTIVAPQVEHFDALRALLCGPSLRPCELVHGFQTADTAQPSLFDPRCSGIIFSDGQPSAACLAVRHQNHFTVNVIVGTQQECRQLLHHLVTVSCGLSASAILSLHVDDRDRPALVSQSLPNDSTVKFLRLTYFLR